MSEVCKTIKRIENMRNFCIALLALIGATGMSGCFVDDVICPGPRGPIVSEDLVMAPFDKVRLLCDASVYISQGSTQDVRVEGPSNMIELIESNVSSNGTWNISLSKCVAGNTDLTFYITVPTIKEVTNSASGYITGETTWVSSQMTLRSEGSGDIWANLRTEDLFVVISGSGDVELEGLADSQTMQITGSGDALAFGLTAQEANLSLTGSGHAKVKVESKLTASLSGSGNVYYKGNPDISKVTSGSGRVINAN